MDRNGPAVPIHGAEHCDSVPEQIRTAPCEMRRVFPLMPNWKMSLIMLHNLWHM